MAFIDSNAVTFLGGAAGIDLNGAHFIQFRQQAEINRYVGQKPFLPLQIAVLDVALSDSVSATDSGVAAYERWANPSDAVSVTDALAKDSSFERLPFDALAPSDTTLPALEYARAGADVVSVSDFAAPNDFLLPPLQDFVSATDATGAEVEREVALLDSLDVDVDALALEITRERSPVDLVDMADTVFVGAFSDAFRENFRYLSAETSKESAGPSASTYVDALEAITKTDV